MVRAMAARLDASGHDTRHPGDRARRPLADPRASTMAVRSPHEAFGVRGIDRRAVGNRADRELRVLQSPGDRALRPAPRRRALTAGAAAPARSRRARAPLE